jgi:hypothetical protein
MSNSILRLEADMMISHVTADAETATDRVAFLTGNTAPRVKEALEKMPVRFSLVTAPSRKIRVAA